jgi:hypothetical protein
MRAKCWNIYIYINIKKIKNKASQVQHKYSYKIKEKMIDHSLYSRQSVTKTSGSEGNSIWTYGTDDAHSLLQ